MDKNSIKVQMCEIPQFDKLDRDEVDYLADYIDKHEMKKGDILLSEGTTGDSLFYIVNGIIEIKKESMDGGQTVLAQFSKGASLGEMGLLENESRRSATAVVIKDCELLVLSRTNFNKIIETNPKLAIKILMNIARSIATRLRHTSGRFADVFRG